MRSIGERILFFRHSRGLKRSALAAEVGISASLLAKVERGDQMVSADQLKHIALILEVSFMYLLTGKGPIEVSQGELMIDPSVAAVAIPYHSDIALYTTTGSHLLAGFSDVGGNEGRVD